MTCTLSSLGGSTSSSLLQEVNVMNKDAISKKSFFKNTVFKGLQDTILLYFYT
jgi:hypothetical protein